MGNTSGVVTYGLGHTIIPDLAADRSGLCSIFVEIANLATKPSSRDDGLVAILAISALSLSPTPLPRLWSGRNKGTSNTQQPTSFQGLRNQARMYSSEIVASRPFNLTQEETRAPNRRHGSSTNHRDSENIQLTWSKKITKARLPQLVTAGSNTLE